MKPYDKSLVLDYVKAHIDQFHQNRINSLDKMKLKDILLRKNPYLFRAKGYQGADELIRALMEAFISSKEETLFGDWLENLAIFINQSVYDGRKSGIIGIDLEFDNNQIRYIVSIKSGPNWGNSGQIKGLQEAFKTAKKTLRTSNSHLNVVAVNGCCYGRDNNPDKGDYFKYCGQRFWAFISGNENLYTDLIVPLGDDAKKRNDAFNVSLGGKVTNFIVEFAKDFCDKKGAINWDALLAFNSGNQTLQRII